jgi:pyridoxal/pyridoxine/pyridoxamine kinase
VKFFFKQTIVHQVTNQKTGKKTKIYLKPKIQTNIRKKATQDSSVIFPNIIEGQLAISDVTSEAKPIKSILSSLFSKFKR